MVASRSASPGAIPPVAGYAHDARHADKASRQAADATISDLSGQGGAGQEQDHRDTLIGNGWSAVVGLGVGTAQEILRPAKPSGRIIHYHSHLCDRALTRLGIYGSPTSVFLPVGGAQPSPSSRGCLAHGGARQYIRTARARLSHAPRYGGISARHLFNAGGTGCRRPRLQATFTEDTHASLTILLAGIALRPRVRLVMPLSGAGAREPPCAEPRLLAIVQPWRCSRAPTL